MLHLTKVSLILFLCGCVCGTVHARPNDHPSSQGPHDTPPPMERTISHFVALHEQIVSLQEGLVTLQADELTRLQDGAISTQDPEGEAALVSMRLLMERLGEARLQLPPAQERFARIPPHHVPMEARRRLEELGIRSRELDENVARGFDEIRTVVCPNHRDLVPSDHDRLDPPRPSTAVAPETREEADQILRSGGLKTPANTIELYERIPASQTSTGRLDDYRSRSRDR